MNQEPASLSRRATLYVSAISLLGAAVLVYSITDLMRHPVGPEWLILIALTTWGSGVIWGADSIGYSDGSGVIWGASGGLTAETTAWKSLEGQTSGTNGMVSAYTTYR